MSGRRVKALRRERLRVVASMHTLVEMQQRREPKATLVFREPTQRQYRRAWRTHFGLLSPHSQPFDEAREKARASRRRARVLKASVSQRAGQAA
jgi:hypothetical protein